MVHLLSQDGQEPRSRLPNAVLRTLAKDTAQQLQQSLPAACKWNGRNVFIADGSHVSMPDTPDNQAAYPQPVVQQQGIGFPLARVAVPLAGRILAGWRRGGQGFIDRGGG
jgi:hypothetical protein